MLTKSSNKGFADGDMETLTAEVKGQKRTLQVIFKTQHLLIMHASVFLCSLHLCLFRPLLRMRF